MLLPIDAVGVIDTAMGLQLFDMATVLHSVDTGTALQTFDTSGADEAFLVGRLIFGGILAFMGLNHFLGLDEMAEYAAYKGLPAPQVSVVASGALLVAAGLGIVVGAFPVLAGTGLAVFLLVSAVTMHDFWAVPEDQQQTEMTQFLKNVALAGGAIALAALGTTAWPYAVDIGLF